MLNQNHHREFSLFILFIGRILFIRIYNYLVYKDLFNLEFHNV